MSDRLTNLGLGLLVTVAVISGFAAFAVGTSPGRWVVILHGVAGLGVLIVSPWKTLIARRGLSKQRRGRGLSLALAGFTIVTLASGVALVTGSVARVASLTTMQIHVGAGLATVAATFIHYRQRPVKARRTDLGRRAALKATATLGVSGIAYLTVEGMLRILGAPGSTRRFTGSHEVTSATPPPTIWLNDTTPSLDAQSHIVELFDRNLTVSELDGFGDTVVATLDCTGGWHSTNNWSGTRLDRLIGDVDGQSIVIRSVTGYWRRFPRSEAGRLWLATRIDTGLLRPGNGAPVRLVAPGRRGFWWIKWVSRVEVDDTPPWWQPPLPLA